jgi:serine/threonine protein kinase/tetratricopeptide (TPR) repeat protein
LIHLRLREVKPIMIETPPSQQFQLGLLALQNQLVSQSSLVSAFETWWTDRSRDLGQILIETGAISNASHQQLIKLIGETNRDSNSTSREEGHNRNRGGIRGSVATEAYLSGMELSKATLKWEHGSADDPPKHLGTIQSQQADGTRFRILRQHASGGLGVVFVAEDLQLHRSVALKQIRNDRGDSNFVRSKFIQEAEITGQLEHPGIVPIYALGFDGDGKPYYAMRLIQGQDLGSRIRQFHLDRQNAIDFFEGPNLKHLLRRFLDVCNAIDYAHSRGVLHRDLKPANIMLGEFGETLVVDWGLAKMLSGVAETQSRQEGTINSTSLVDEGKGLDSSATSEGQFLGTAAYASPEQLLGKMEAMGPFSDVYSLGAILFELLTGHSPLTDELKTPRKIAERILNGEIRSPRRLISACPPALDSICKKAMAGKTDQRYQSAAELKGDLEAWLDDAPCTAHPDTIATRSKRWIRHHPGVSGTFTAIVVCSAIAIAALFGISATKNRQILAEKNDAEAVTKFLTSALQSTDSDKSGENVTVAEVLRASELALKEDRAMTPNRKVHIASAILDSFIGLGLSDEAIHIAEYMNEICDQALDPSTPDTLLSRCYLATAYWCGGRSKEAIELLEENLPLLQATLAESNADTLSVQDNLAQMYAQSGRKDEAERLGRSTLATYKKYNLLDTPNALQSANNLAILLVENGRRDEGLTMFRDAIGRAEKSLSPTHTITLGLLHSLADTITDPKESLEVSRKAYQGALYRYGADHRMVITIRNTFTASLVSLELWEEAIPLVEASEADCIRLNTDHSETARHVRAVLMAGYLRTERYQGAERLARKMLLPEYAETAGLNPPLATTALAIALVRQNRSQEANEVITQMPDTQGNEELSLASRAVLKGLNGEIALAAGDYDKAIEMLTASWQELEREPKRVLYHHVPGHFAIAMAEAYAQKHDDANRMLWLEKAKALGVVEKKRPE